jgi:zinc/manganese transport system substrate-binding protein
MLELTLHTYIKSIFICFLFLTEIAWAKEKLNVVATLPELAWVVQTIGQKHVHVNSLLTGREDAHFVDASPSFVLKTAKADLLIFNGLELEIGWLPKVVEMSGRKQIQIGERGSCDGSSYVAKEQVLTDFDRSMGDVHPQGNPHYTLSIKQMIKVAQKVHECLQIHLPIHKELLQKNYQGLIESLEELHQKIFKLAGEHLKDKKFLTYHSDFIYYFNDLGLTSLGTLEKTPGIPPSAIQLAEMTKFALKAKPDMVLANMTNPEKYLMKFKEVSGVSYLMLPTHMIQGKFKNYDDFQMELISSIIKHVSNH